MAHEVFISYSSDDKSVADTVCSYLEINGIRCWIAPRDIPPGIKYAQGIMDAINDSRTMVVIFSAGANKSGHVSAEIERAMSKGLIIIPFRIEAVMPTGEMEYFLSGRHWLDALTIPLEQHIIKLVVSVWAILGKRLPESSVNTPGISALKTAPILKKKLAKALPFMVAGILILAVAFVLLINALSNHSENESAGENGRVAAGRESDAAEPGDTRKPPGTHKPSNSEKPTDTQKPSDKAKPDDTAEPGENAIPFFPFIIGLPSGGESVAPEGGDRAPEKNEAAPEPARDIKAEIADSIISGGWSKFRLENNGPERNFDVIVKGMDANGNMLSLEYVSMGNIPQGESADGSVYMSGNPEKQELYIVADYWSGPKIQEQMLLGGWAHVILINGGDEGDFDIVAKGFDSDGNMIALEPVRIEGLQKNGIAKGSVYLSGNPAKLEVYIMEDYGNGPKIQEQMLAGGWVNVILANGGDDGSFHVDVKGYDADGKAIAMETINFEGVPSNSIAKGSVYLSGNPSTFKASVR